MNTQAPPPRGVSIVVPAYNEEARLAALFEALLSHAEQDLAGAGLDYRETVIVDDGSTDATSGLLHAAAAEDVRIRPVLGSDRNHGKGAAVAAGVRAARAEMVLIVDVDLSTPLGDAWRLSEVLEQTGARIAIGSRDIDRCRVVAPLHRRFLGAGFNVAVRRLTGLDMDDTQCGFKLMETAVARQLLAQQMSRGFAWDVEMLMRARNAGLVVAEAPVTYVHDHRSKVRVVRASLQMAADLARVSWRLRRAGKEARSTLPLEDADRT